MSEEIHPEQRTDALARSEPKLEVIKRNGRDVAIARSKGKFANVTTAATVELAKVIRQTTHTAKENGKTDFQEIIEKNNAVAKANTEAKALGAVSQWTETLDILGGTRDARKNLQEPEAQNASLTVDTGGLMAQMLMGIITELIALLSKHQAVPEHLIVKNLDEAKDRSPKRPSFASESAPFIDAELVQQNAPASARPSFAKPKHERRVAQIPLPYNTYWRRKDDPRL